MKESIANTIEKFYASKLGKLETLTDLDAKNLASQISELLYEWGKEPCPHNHRGKLTKIGVEPLLKRECPACWQSLK